MAMLDTVISIANRSSNAENTLIGHVTKPLLLNVGRKASLIINPNIGLRSRNSHIVDSLLYVEYDENGKIINRFPMRNLADVKNFFQSNPNIEICYDRCPGDAELEDSTANIAPSSKK
ncbi:hypothetical protein evm_015535 [Chilo suppressalis]|nr:hypothetical protein evm_015535 [Chilo suppressalis]